MFFSQVDGVDDATFSEALNSIKGKAEISLDQFKIKVGEMVAGAQGLNNAFGQSRQRITEMMTAVSEAAPRVTRLGGNIQQSTQAIADISSALKRNVIASAESVEKLYATTQVLGQSTDTLVSNFSDVGIQFSQIGPQMEDSVKYVQNLGLNTKEVMGQVVNNVDKLNKYNFADGVQGITKMAAKAAMLKVDLSEVFQFADSVMDPENAINMASAFQRLGVSAGNLVDPFALMNESINDPGALQDSIANIAKQYTYFDEKTKSFRINPQGILTMKQISKETGISYDTLSKAGLAASELDSRLSQISPRINFKDESDKQFLSNIAQMNEKGEYVVKIKDQAGIEQTKLLSEVTQQEFDNLIEQQKNAPKSMEDIAREQLDTTKLLESDVEAIRDGVLRGFAQTKVVRETLKEGRKVIGTVTGAVSGALDKPELYSKPADKAIATLSEALKGLAGGKKSLAEVMEEAGSKFGVQGTELKKTFGDITTNIFNKLGKDISKFDDKGLEGLAKDAFSKLSGVEKSKLESTFNKPTKTSVYSSSSLLDGTNTNLNTSMVNTTSTTTPNKIVQSVDYSGTIVFKVDAPPGVTTDYLNQYLNSEKFKEAIYQYVQEKNKQLEKTK